MRSVFSLVLIIGIALSALAVYVVRNYVSTYRNALVQERQNSGTAVQLTEVYVIKKNARFGEQISPEDVHLVKWPVVSVPVGAFTKDNPIFTTNDAPRFAVRVIEKGEPIMATKVTEPGSLASLTSKIGPGMRAFTIEVDAKSGVSGFLRPSDRVDVYWTGTPPILNENDSALPVTRLIETNVELIAVDQVSEIDQATTRVAKTVTVSITPQQVAKLALGQATGSLYLSLLSPEEMDVAIVDEVDKLTLFGGIQAERTLERVCTIKSRKGADVVITEIPCSE